MINSDPERALPLSVINNTVSLPVQPLGVSLPSFLSPFPQPEAAGQDGRVLSADLWGCPSHGAPGKIPSKHF